MVTWIKITSFCRGVKGTWLFVRDNNLYILVACDKRPPETAPQISQCGTHAGPQHVRDESLPLAHLVPDHFSDIADYTNDSFISSLEPVFSAWLQNHHLCCYLACVITDLWLHPLVLPYLPQSTPTPQVKVSVGHLRSYMLICIAYQPRAFSQLKKKWQKLP